MATASPCRPTARSWWRDQHNGSNDFALVRYNSDGTLDTSFSGDGKLTTAIGAGNDFGYSVTVQADGKILVAGASHNGSNYDFALVRYNSDGTLDTSFSGDGKLTTAIGASDDYGYSVTVQADGKILVAGYSANGSNNDFALVRYNSDGTLDTSFSGDGKLTTAIGAGHDEGYSVTVQADGKILVAGYSSNGSNDDFALVRYNSDGTLDTSFDFANTLGGTVAFTEGGAAVVLDADVQVLDAELGAADNFNGATLTLARNGGANAQDLFSATGTLAALTQGGSLIVGGTTIGTVTTNSGGTLLLTLNSNATNTLVNSALQQIAYSNSSDAPPASVQINWTFNDGNAGAQGSGGPLTATGSVTVNITPVNDPSVLAAIEGTALAYTENQAATAITATITASDVDNTNLASATIQITGNYENGQDVLSFTNTASITGTWTAATGTLTLTGSDTVANYQAALRAVKYQNTSDNPSGLARTVSFTVNDGTANSNTVTRNITVAAVNDGPMATITPASYAATEQVALTLKNTGLSISDVDAGAGSMTVTLSVTEGTLTVTAGGSGAVVTNSGTSSVTITGTVTQINNLLSTDATSTVSYIDNTDTPSASATLTLQVNDNGNTGGGSLTNSDTATINLTAVNDAPTAVITPATYAATEQVALTLHGTGLSIADVDAGAAAVRATVSVTSGILTAAAGTTGVTVTGSGTASVTLDGTLTQINNLLAGNLSGTLTYTINSDTPAASATLTLTASDLGNTGTGGTLTGSDTATINITAVNDAPTATITPATYAATEQVALTLHGTGLSIADVDAGAAAVRATVSVTSGILTAAAGTTGVTVTGSGTASVTLDGTLTQINNLLAGNLSGTLTYTINSDTPAASATLTLTASDLGNTGTGGTLTGSDTATINITAVNDAPTATITPATYAATEQVALTLHGTGLSIADVDAGAAAVRATVSVTSGILTAAAGSTGVTVTGSGTSSVTLDGTLTQINNLLAGSLSGTLTYTANSDAPAASATLTLTASDLGNTGTGGTLTGSDTATINISAVNDAPTATITPATYAATEQVALTLKNTGLSISDVDAGAGSMTVTLSVTEGTLTVTAGGSGAVVTNSGTSSVTITGTVTQINNLLSTDGTSTVSYIDNTDTPSASATLTLQVNDNGNTGGGSLTNSDTATINITAVNDGPVLSIPGSQSVSEDTNLVFSSANGNQISVSDADAGSGSLEVSLSMTNGTLTLSGTAGLTFVSGANGTGAMQFTGTLSNLNAALNGMVYSPPSNFQGAAGLGITVSDQGNTGSGGPLSDSRGLGITVNAVNDPPAITSDGGGNSASLSVAENTTAVTTVTSTDVDGGTPVYSLAGGADAAKFTIHSSTGELSFLAAPDYESPTDVGGNNVYDVIVQVSDGAGGTDTQALAVTVTAVNDNNPVITSNGGGATASVNVAENTTAVTTVTATDADVPSPTLSYSIAGGADAAMFTIDSGNGTLSFVSGRNRESHTDADSNGVYEVTVQASDGTLSDTQSISVTITDVDEFDVGPVADSNAAANAVNENAANGTAVGITASASDADATTNAITYSLTDSAGGRFAIHASTGVVTVAGAIDRETAASYNITVRATSADTSYATQTFTIAVNDVDEFDVGAVTDSNAAANTVAENAGVGTAVGLTGLASDADATATISYSLDDNAGGRFAIHATTGVVTVNAALDYETSTSHSVTIRATSSDGSFSTQSFTIQVTDINEAGISAISDTDGASDLVLENAANGTTVGLTAFASDPDAGDTVSYSLDDNAGGRFAIHATTGVVTVAAGIDREAAGSYGLTVRATSSDTTTTTRTFTITIGDVDEFDVGSVTDSNGTANSVAENAANGTTVGTTAAASDADATTNGITYSLDDNAGGRFTIHGTTGVVTVANSSLLNYEAATSHAITVRATSADTSFSTQAFTINLTDVDEFDVGTVTDSNGTANSVAENAANGTTVGITATASDADGTTNTITYSLDDDAGGRFAIHATTGVVTVAGSIDRETAASYNITVRATSADTSFSTQVFTIAVNDLDEFDVTAPADSNATANAVNENAANGTAVGITAVASDADATTNAVTYSLTDSAGGRFAIDANTGVVTVANGTLLDREAAASHNITVRATSADGSTADTAFTINVNDVDEFDVGTVSDTDATANAVNENAVNGTTVGITAAASDADATTNAITYSLDDNAGGRFTIHASTGVVTVAGAIDRETAASYNITVRATSADTSFSTQVFTIAINDLDEFDVGPVTDSNAAANTVAENAGVGTAVGLTGLASDADATATISYSLDDNAGGRFAIHATTGVVTVNAALDYETSTSHSVTIRATSSDGSFSTQSFTIQVTDINEAGISAISDTDGASDLVLENAANGTTVGLTAFASDPDAGDTVSYSLDDNAGGRFAIHATTGVVTVAAGIDREAAGSYGLTVRATSSDTTTTTRTFTITIGDVDEFDVGSVTDSNGTANSVAENAANGTAVGLTALASDADATTNAITYSLDDNAGGRFTIHGTTGVVTVANSSLLNYEAATSHAITVRATSADTSFSTQAFTINLTDVDEFDVGTVTDSNGTANSVAENAANGTTVGITATASDADGTTNTITYSLDDDAGGRFAIHATTGVVTVAGSIDRETAASYNITVRATSADTSFSTQVFTIAVNDLDEFDVTAPADSNATANAVNENAANGTAVGITAVASDADATTNAVTYSLTDSAGGRFAIDANTGVVTVANGTLLDREAAASHNITVRATSADGSTADTAFTINVNDVDEFDVGTVSDTDATANAVNENAVNGTTVGITAAATDADATTNAITYSLDDNAGGRFAINSSSGVVTVAGAIDRETAASYNITVRATSADTSFSTQVFTIAINDLDEFDVGAVTDSNAAANTVAENAGVGTAVGLTGLASDADVTATISYSLDDSAGGRFAIHATTGVVTVNAALDYETSTSHSVTIRATSSDGSFSTQSFTIQVTDINEAGISAISDTDGASDLVLENAANGTTVGLTAFASDPDAGDTVSYSLDDNAGGRFAIHATTGVVTVAAGIDREAAGSYGLTVRATSSDTTTTTRTFTITIGDVDEFDVVAVTDSNAAANAVNENAAIGTAVGVTASAADADATTNTISYSLEQDAGGRFTIHATTGVVTVAGAIDRETAASYNITVRATSADTSYSTQTFTITINDVDEFDVGAVTDSDATANAVNENAVNGTTVGITAAASDADAHHQRDHLLVGRRCRRTICDPRQHGCGHCRRSHRSRSGGQLQHHGAGRERRRFVQHPDVHDRCQPAER